MKQLFLKIPFFKNRAQHDLTSSIVPNQNLFSYWPRVKSPRLLSKTALVLAIVFSLVSFNALAQDPGKGGTVAGFEVDSDFKSGFIPSWWNATNYSPNVTTKGDDWSKGVSGNAVLKQESNISVPGRSADGRGLWQVDGNWGTQSAVAEIVSFAGSSNKNGNPIGTGQSPYSLQLGGSGPQKNDITNTYLHSRDVNGDTWLFFGAETRATNGNSYIDFEYNQAGVQITGTQLIGNGLVKGRTVNDFLLVVNYTGGGNRPVIGIRKWLATGTWSNELPVSTLGAFITTNAGSIDPVAPNKGFGSEGAYANTVMPLQFVEGGINVSAIPDFASLNKCDPRATVTVKTRSSSSYTAELKDLDVLNFQLVPAALLTDLTPVSKCPGQSASFNTTVSGDGAQASNVEWYLGTTKLSNGGRYTITVSGSTSTLTINNLVPNDGGTYKAVLTGSTCGNPERTAALTMNPVPVGTNTSQTLCPTSIGGSTAIFDLTSKNSTVTGSVAGVSVVGWYETYTVAGGFSNPISTAAQSAYNSGNKTVYAQLSGTGGCIGVAENVLSVTPSPAGTNTTMSVCPSAINGTSGVFDLTSKDNVVNSGVATVTVTWYENYTEVGGFTNTIATPTAYTSGNKTVYAKLSGASNCIGVAENVLIVTFSPVGTNTTMESCPTTSGGTTAVFDLTSKNATVVGASGASVLGWYDSYSGGVFSSAIANPAAYTSATGNTVYAKLSGTGSCNGVAENALTVNPSAPGPDVTYNAPACDEAFFSVTVTNPIVGATYTIVDNNNANSASIPVTAVGQEVKFTNRVPGSGYSVTATIGQCISEATSCGIPTNRAIPTIQSSKAPEGKEEVKSTPMTAFPIPFSDKTTLEFKSGQDEDYVINLYDLKGNLVKQLKSGKAKMGEVIRIEVDGSKMAESMYLARKVSKTGVNTVKLLKQK